jgi:hypothetical protein
MSVRKVTLPPDVRELSTLAHVDYEDCFVFDTDAAQDRTAEQWARAILEGSPAAMRHMLRSGWLSLGLQLGSTAPSDQRVLGWHIRSGDPDVAIIGATSRIGFDADLLVMRQERSMLFSTMVQIDNVAAKALWVGLAPGHQVVVRQVLEQAVRRGDCAAQAAGRD